MKSVNFEYSVAIEDVFFDRYGELTDEGREVALDYLIDGITDTTDGWFPRHTVTDMGPE